jgi:hypothetical protein
MYKKYFVLITDEVFGYFLISAQEYPDTFLQNLDKVVALSEEQLESYLLENIDYNTLLVSQPIPGHCYSTTPYTDKK